MLQTSTTNFDKTVQVLIRKRLEELLRAPLPHLMDGNYLRANFVKGSNGTMRFINIPDLDVTTGTPTPGTPPWLVEGVPPASEDLTIGYEEFTAHQAGRVIKITDVALLESPFDLMVEAADRVARNVLAFADKIAADVLLAGTNVIYSDATNPQVNNSVDDILAVDVLTSRDIRRAVAFLRGTNVPTFSDGKYRAIIHPFVTFDVESDDVAGAWIDAQRYASPDNLVSGEMGTYGGVRFFSSSASGVSADVGASSVDVYSTIVFGPGAYVFGDYGSLETHLTPPGGHDDPLFQSALIGWKAFLGAMLIGEGDNATNVSEPRYVRIASHASLGA